MCRTDNGDEGFMDEAVLEALRGRDEGGIPIGAVLVLDGRIVARGRNQRVQRGSMILHAEMDCLENAGRMGRDSMERAVLYSTLSPCIMCSGAILLYGIRRVVVGDRVSYEGAGRLLVEGGVDVIHLDRSDCQDMMGDFIRDHRDLWSEDIGLSPERNRDIE